ncbi:MAG: hypothetical protein ACU833_08855 [Gammaproteobacteria bacterium]
MFEKIKKTISEYPLISGIFAADFAVLLFYLPPFIISVVMLGGLVVMSVFLGQKLSLFK